MFWEREYFFFLGGGGEEEGVGRSWGKTEQIHRKLLDVMFLSDQENFWKKIQDETH